MKHKLSVADKVLAVLYGRTQLQAASILGVSVRTIRRWKNEGVEPSHALGNDTALSRAAANARRTVRRRAKRDPFPYKEPDLPVPPVGKRSELNVRDQDGRPTGKKYLGDWVNYDVRSWDNLRIFELVKWGRDHDKIVQFIYLIPVGSKYKNRRGRVFDHKGVLVISRGKNGQPLYDFDDKTGEYTLRHHLERRAIHGGTIPRSLTDYTDTELWETIENVTRHDLAGKHHPILFVGFLEPGRVGRAPRAPYQPKRIK